MTAATTMTPSLRIKFAAPAALFLLIAAAAFAQTGKPASASDDPVLRAMQEELDRSKTSLKLENVAAPYYIEYRVIDIDDYSAEAAYGALRAGVRSRARFLRVAVRVGDYKQDGYFGQGDGAFNMLDFMPLDDDNLAMRHQLWLATDRAYRAAAQIFSAKQAQLKQLTIDQPVDDFSQADPVQSIGALAKLEVDPEPWNKMLQDASAVYKSDPQIEVSEANLKFEAVNQYFINSEGTVVRSGRNLYEMYVSSLSQAADGMSLQRNNGFVFPTMKELPSAEDFVGRARKLAASLKDLRDAPLVDEEYRGPVLFSADAATTVFADLVGENVLGRRPELGKNARTTGAFATSYKSRVLPEFISVAADPTLASYQGQSLLGHYEIDDEGVPAQRVSLIEKGTLVNYLIGREPIRDFPKSNGHARSRLPSPIPTQIPASPLPHISNLMVTSSEPLAKDALKKKFLDLCRQRDLPYCYRVETFGPKLTPRLLYKIWTKDGHEELVRGGSFGDLDARALRSDLVATGDDFFVDNHPLNSPHAIVAPSILFDELEVKRTNVNKDKLPEYPAPDLGK
jgi:TldD protein